MASYQTTVTLVAPASGNVLLPNGSTVVTISLDVTAQAAVAAALAAQMANYVAQGQVVTKDSMSSYGVALPASARADVALREPPAEMVQTWAFGDSYGLLTGWYGTQFVDRVVRRIGSQLLYYAANAALNMVTPGTINNRCIAGSRADQVLELGVRPFYPANFRGLVLLPDVLLNSTQQDADAGVTCAEAFRSILAYLTARAVLPITDTGMVFGPGWTNGVSDGTAGRTVDRSFTGDAVTILDQRGVTGGVYTIKNSAGTVIKTVTTSGWAQSFTGATILTGFGSGDHTVRLTVTSGTVTLSGALIPQTNPPTIVWWKPGPVNSVVSDVDLATWTNACAAVAATFPTVLALGVDGNWDKTTMLAADGLHPNEKGHVYIANIIQNALLSALTFRQGLNQLTAANDGAYTSPAANYTSPGATAPTAPSGVAGVAGHQVTVSWTRNSDGGATVTSQKVQASLDSGTTWTDVATVGPSVTSLLVTTGLTDSTPYVFRVQATNAIGTSTSSASASVTIGQAVITYASDTMTTAGALTSTEVGGLAYTVNNGTFAKTAGVLKSSGVADTTKPQEFTWDAGHATGTVTWTMTGVAPVNGEMFVFHVGGTSDAQAYVLWSNAGIYTVAKRTGLLQANYAVLFTSAVVPATGDVLVIVMKASTTDIYVNGTLLYTITDTAYNANTKAGGCVLSTVVGTWDNMNHTNLVSYP
jgi:hypothetical protein